MKHGIAPQDTVLNDNRISLAPIGSTCSSCSRYWKNKQTRTRWQRTESVQLKKPPSQSMRKKPAQAEGGCMDGPGGALWLMPCRPTVSKNKDLACY
eukprot:4495867-Pleurochrysis_carterae.AAC.1